MALFVLAFILLLPLLEIFIFIRVGGAIGAPLVILLTVASAAGGIALVRLQGFGTLVRARAEIDAGRPPVAEALHGALLVVAGLLLLIPGFLTDMAGALLLVPPLRRRLVGGLVRHAGQGRRPVIIEADYWHHDAADAPPPPSLDDDRKHDS